MGLVTEMTDPTQIMLRDIPIASEIENNIDKLPLDLAKSVFIQRCKLFASRHDTLSDNMNKLYAVIWGQSSLALQTEIISLEDYEDEKKTFDCL